MPDFLTRRNGTWHFVRRVPVEFAQLDSRGVIKHSTRIKIAYDRAGRRAARVAEKFNEQLEIFWKGLSDGRPRATLNSYEHVRLRARALGFEYIENDRLIQQPTEARLERLEALVTKRGLANAAGARAALLGTQKRPVFKLSALFEEYEAATEDEVRDLSPGQLRIWRNGRIRAVERFVEVVGDKLVTEVNADDGIDYCEWWRERVTEDAVDPKTANPRVPYDTDFVQNRLFAEGALAGLNEDARLVLYVVADTGLRPSEVVNLREDAIVLGSSIPYVRILPDGRRLKTEDSRREIPLVGAALAAMWRRPEGFPRYRDKSSNLSATLNKYLLENGLRPTKDHTVYSLRHSFKDRLVAVEAPDSLIDSLMGHKTYKPKYGRGPRWN